MNVSEFMSLYRNHPVLFVGTGISLRYLSHSYTWDGLLRKIAFELKGDNEFYLDIKSKCQEVGQYRYEKIALRLEKIFNESLENDRNGKFKHINDQFYTKMDDGQNVSRFKMYVAELLSSLEQKIGMEAEIDELKKARKNIGSVITTNYDKFIQELFAFNPLVGNEILLSNPYGSAYKIHGCVTEPSKLIISSEDYENFRDKYELIRAQLLSLFIHNPIIFLGYNIGDENIKDILKTIFTYVEPNSGVSQAIRKNFLLVEYDQDSLNEEITEHDIDLEGFATIRINKIKTDNFVAIYRALADLKLPISAMDVRKVQSIVQDIYSGGNIKVTVTEDIDALNPNDKILVIGSKKTIQYSYQNAAEMMSNYFKIIEEENAQLLVLINKHNIRVDQYFPVFGFGSICNEIVAIARLKGQQVSKLQSSMESIPERCKNGYRAISDIEADIEISRSNLSNAIFWSVMEGCLPLDEFADYLRVHGSKQSTDYKKLLCAYDYKKYGP
jgi:hypothetical protein